MAASQKLPSRTYEVLSPSIRTIKSPFTRDVQDLDNDDFSDVNEIDRGETLDNEYSELLAQEQLLRYALYRQKLNGQFSEVELALRRVSERMNCILRELNQGNEV